MAHSASTNLNQPGRRVAAAVFPWPRPIQCTRPRPLQGGKPRMKVGIQSGELGFAIFNGVLASLIV
jgi:hypothetical protein